MYKSVENVIEWLNGSGRATVTLSQLSQISKVRKLAAKYPDDCQIVVQNSDGSVVVHLPVEWVRIAPPKMVTSKQRCRARGLMEDYNAKYGMLPQK